MERYILDGRTGKRIINKKYDYDTRFKKFIKNYSQCL